ncbi:DUF2975 domain-containing protein [Enterobacter cancerogenus]|uniref:DUF2975 domain-containing protein n=1 Tax=Enterobacter cancerogenus TaxID=69218 RepID=UPI0018AF6417|nr:DUF2975 domain-containing protein [Enterobacter cancerogenus]
MEMTLLAGMVGNPILNQTLIWFPKEREIPISGGYIYSECSAFLGCHSNVAASMVTSLLNDFIISTMLWQFYKMFKSIRTGDIFNQLQITRITVAGGCLIGLSIFSLISDMYLLSLKNTHSEFHFGFQIENFFYIPIGIGLVILGYVLKLALIIKEEQELVI